MREKRKIPNTRHLTHDRTGISATANIFLEEGMSIADDVLCRQQKVELQLARC